MKSSYKLLDHYYTFSISVAYKQIPFKSRGTCDGFPFTYLTLA